MLFFPSENQNVSKTTTRTKNDKIRSTKTRLHLYKDYFQPASTVGHIKSSSDMVVLEQHQLSICYGFPFHHCDSNKITHLHKNTYNNKNLENNKHNSDPFGMSISQTEAMFKYWTFYTIYPQK